LYSEALIDPSHQIQFNINEPTSANSQIQEFLDLNLGSGIQHIALKTNDILQTIQQMRNLGLTFLEIPSSYYQKLDQQYRAKILSFLKNKQWQQLKQEQILLDFPAQNPQSLLMQIFSQPIFEKPTFFFEFIERRDSAEGFGEGNFLALFEAMETEQRERNLK
jgi:4-hydroxyphenylpyruvate dioxygenase